MGDLEQGMMEAIVVPFLHYGSGDGGSSEIMNGPCVSCDRN